MKKIFLGTEIIKLEQNYRCTGSILNCANSIIKNNETKYEKKLWTKNEDGSLPEVFRSEDEYGEANFVVKKILSLKSMEYYKNSDFAILYRTNSQSRVLEQVLVREQIPYKVIGGLKFFERKEIKDAIAYLRLIQNTNDNLSLSRIINEPKRGVGNTSLTNIEEISSNEGISMYDIIKDANNYGLTRVFSNTREFIDCIETLRKDKEELKISELLSKTLKITGYLNNLQNEDKADEKLKAESRIDNLDQLLTMAEEFEKETADGGLEEFLEDIALSSDVDNLEEGEETVTLMTLHSAKGLEFPVVFMVGMEEGLFPSYKSIGEPKELEEERRLCYVGITRAKEKLFLVCSKMRTTYGSTSYNQPSRFIKEIPKEMLEGKENLEESSSRYDEQERFSDYGKLDWSYGKSKTNSWGGSPVKSYVSSDLGATAKADNKFQFRSADSFLKSLNNKPKATENIDLDSFNAGVKVFHKKFGEGVISKVEAER